MEYLALDEHDHELIQAATETIRKNYLPGRHVVGAALRCASGNVYTGVNVRWCAHGWCAEPVAVGTAVTQGEREFVAIVAVAGWDETYPVIPPCGNCRQLLIDYAPEAMVILEHDGKLVKISVRNLLPDPFYLFEESYTEAVKNNHKAREA
jgi:cytidine deaminase